MDQGRRLGLQHDLEKGLVTGLGAARLAIADVCELLGVELTAMRNVVDSSIQGTLSVDRIARD